MEFEVDADVPISNHEENILELARCVDPEWEVRVAKRFPTGMADARDLLIRAARAFSTAERGVVWDGEWMEAITEFATRLEQYPTPESLTDNELVIMARNAIH